METKFYLEWYDNKSEDLVYEIEVPGATIAWIRDWLQLPEEADTRSGGFLVTPDKIAEIVKHFGLSVDQRLSDTEKYSCFIFQYRA